ncbi:MAG: hypothetical protein ABSD57_04090 [Verrucomicrobiota bacterium]|jgi:uncharacterized repeat protein (TIGR01451 family)
MKPKIILIKYGLAVAMAVIIAGCATQQPNVSERQNRNLASIDQVQAGYDTFGRKWGEPAPAPAPTEPKAAPAPAAPSSTQPCAAEIRSGLVHLAKKVPAEATLGQEYMTELDATAVACADNIVVVDHVPAGASFVRSDPPAQVDGDKLTWNLPDMNAGQAQSIKVWLRADKEGTLTSCATVKADPKVCGDTRVVKPDIQLTKSEPGDVIVCDPIPVTLVVKNTGSSRLTGVKVIDNLPGGLTSDGRNSLVFDAGTLAPGESKEFKFNATAATTGKYQNPAQATSDQGVSAKASASTAVHQAVLALSCKAREQQYMGRLFNVCFTVSNSGDVPAAGAQVVMPIPAGLTVNSATAGGHMSGNNLVWDLGSLSVNAPQDLCATFASANAGTFDFKATAKGTCAAAGSTSCSTKVVGIAAILLEKADDPDPVAVGETTTYTVKVTNQGSADDSNVRVVVTIAPELVPVSASEGTIDGQTVTLPVVPKLPAKQAVAYKIVAKGVRAGDGHTKFTLSSDMLKSPITAEESTTIY